MKNQNPIEIKTTLSELVLPSATELTSMSATMHKAYHEMSEVPVVEMDALSALESNVQALTDLHSRLSFLNRELRYLLKAE